MTATPAAAPGRSLSVRTLLLALALVCALPPLVLSLVLVVRGYGADVERVQTQLLETARALRLALDRDLEGRVQALEVLATSPALRSGDLAGFRAQAEAVSRQIQPGSSIILGERTGVQLLNTLVPPGEPLPRRTDMATVQRVFETGRPVVSNLLYGPVRKAHVVGISIPVRRDGAVAYELIKALPASAFRDLLARQQVPEHWTVSIVDGNNVVVARNRDSDRLTGQPITDTLRQRLEQGDEGRGMSTNLEGEPVLTAFSRSNTSRWTIAIGLPADTVNGPLLTSLVLLLAAGAALTGLSALLARHLGERISGPVRQLAAAAAAPAGAQALQLPRSGLREADAVAQALEEADGARRASEEKLRIALEAGRVGQWETVPATPDILWSDSMYRMLGREPPADRTGPYRISKDAARAMIVAEDVPRVSEAVRAALSGEAPLNVEYRVRGGDGSIRWVVSRGEVVRDRSGGSVRLLGIDIDVTDRRRAEEQQRLLMREVDHRAKNALALAQAIVKLTPADEPARYVASIEGRLTALARAHSLLAAVRWRGADLTAIVTQELEPYRSGDRVTIAGPPLMAAPEAAQPLAMMFHELATNAARHGALSGSAGQLRVTWQAAPEGPVEITWVESGGPSPAAPPTRRGFGSALLENLTRQLHGEIALSWTEGGLQVRLRLPADVLAPAAAET